MPEGGTMKKIVMYSLGTASLAIAGLVLVPTFAGAQSVTGNTKGNGGGYGYQQVIETKAKTLGMTEAELKTQLETKTLLEIAEEKGISEDQLHASMQKAAQQRWVYKGLTQAEIDSRMQNMQERQAGDHEANSANRGGGMGLNRHNQ